MAQSLPDRVASRSADPNAVEFTAAQLSGVIWRRVFAYAVDLIAIASISVVAILLFVPAAILSLGLLASPLSLVFGLIPVAYHTLLIGSGWSATLGQRLFDIRVMDLSGSRPTYVQAAVQSIVFYASIAFTSFLVLLVVFLNPRRRTLHDFLSGTVVVRRAATQSAATPKGECG